jgi:hypothetical protein
MSDVLHTIHLPDATSSELLAAALVHLLAGDKAQILVERGHGPRTINALRVALSRSRKRNVARGKKIQRFTLNHSIYPFTDDRGRFDALVLSVKKNRTHRAMELVDDMIERNQLGRDAAYVAG